MSQCRSLKAMAKVRALKEPTISLVRMQWIPGYSAKHNAPFAM